MTEPAAISLRIPNPFSEGRNCVYVIPSDPLTLIDSGTASDRAFNELVSQLDEHGFSIRDVGRVILTHKHIDHIGNAWRIQHESDAEILIHESEMQSIADVDPDSIRFKDLVADRLTEWSVPKEMIPQPKEAANRSWAIQSAHPTGLVDGHRIVISCGELEVLHTPGHTAGSICVKFGRQLFSGDHVLPNTTPNIGGGDMRQRGLLKRFLGSLERTIGLAPDVDLVLPGHGGPFEHLAERCREIIDHHKERLKQTAGFLQQGPLSTYEMARCLFGEMHDFHVVLGCAEAQAHLEYLVDDGSVHSEDGMYSLPST